MEEFKKHSTLITFIGQILVVASFYFNMKSEIGIQSREIETLKMFAQESREDREQIHKKIEVDNKDILIEITKIQKDIQFIKEKFNVEKL